MLIFKNEHFVGKIFGHEKWILRTCVFLVIKFQVLAMSYQYFGDHLRHTLNTSGIDVECMFFENLRNMSASSRTLQNHYK